MRIVVTGGTGFVGRPLVERLCELGHEVALVSRSPERAKKGLGVREAWAWEELEECFATPVHAVFHLAGETVQGRWTSKKEEAVWESRIQTTTRLAEVIQAATVRPSVWISASGIGFYGEGGEVLLSEESLAGEDYFARLCVEWEGIARASESSDLRVVCARFGIIIGQGGGALKAMLLPAKSGLSGPLGTGKQWWSWIALPDVVRALVHALEQDAIRGPLNVVAPEPIRQADFQRSLCRALHRPAWIPAPAFGVRLLLGRFADEVLASKRVTPRVLSETGFEWSFPTLESIFGDLFSNTNKGVFLALLGSVALLAAPYGRTPHLIDIARDYSTSPFGLDVMLHAGMHLALVPWLFVALYFRPFKG